MRLTWIEWMPIIYRVQMSDELIKTMAIFRSIDKVNGREYLNDISTNWIICVQNETTYTYTSNTNMLWNKLIRILLCQTDLWLFEIFFIIILIDSHFKRNHYEPISKCIHSLLVNLSFGIKTFQFYRWIWHCTFISKDLVRLPQSQYYDYIYLWYRK